MNVTAPDWLTLRHGKLRPGSARQDVFLLFDDEPQYRLTPVPAAGKYGCKIVQTINGKQVPVLATFVSADEAVRGGLEELRKVLGW